MDHFSSFSVVFKLASSAMAFLLHYYGNIHSSNNFHYQVQIWQFEFSKKEVIITCNEETLLDYEVGFARKSCLPTSSNYYY